MTSRCLCTTTPKQHLAVNAGLALWATIIKRTYLAARRDTSTAPALSRLASLVPILPPLQSASSAIDGARGRFPFRGPGSQVGPCLVGPVPVRGPGRPARPRRGLSCGGRDRDDGGDGDDVCDWDPHRGVKRGRLQEIVDRYECEPSSPPRVCVPKSIPLAYPLTPDIGLPSHPDLPAASEKCAETCVETFQQRTQGCPMSISLTLGGSHPPRRKGIGSESLPIMGTNHHNLKRGVFHNNHPQSGLQRWSKS